MIAFDNVSKMYRGAPKPALNNVSINIGAGAFVFLWGLQDRVNQVCCGSF